MQAVVAVILFLALIAPCAFGAYDAYLRLDGIDGEASAEGREKWIDVHSVSHGHAGRDHASVALVKRIDAASPLLAAHCAAGIILPEAIIDLVRRDETSVRFYRLLLKDVMISRVEVQAAGEDETVVERIELDFGYVEWGYTEFDEGQGRIEDHITYWDLLSGTGGTKSGGGGDPPPPGVGFRMRAELKLSSEDGNSAVLTWRSLAGVTYEIFYAPTLWDEFDTLVATVPSAGDGTTSASVEMPGRLGFFIVKEVVD